MCAREGEEYDVKILLLTRIMRFMSLLHVEVHLLGRFWDDLRVFHFMLWNESSYALMPFLCHYTPSKVLLRQSRLPAFHSPFKCCHSISQVVGQHAVQVHYQLTADRCTKLFLEYVSRESLMVSVSDYTKIKHTIHVETEVFL